MTTARSTSKRRENAALWAATLTRGPAELLDFLLPLWAGIALEASATQVGMLIAAETLVSFLARPLAGVLADARERRTVAAMGAVLYAVSCVGYAVAGEMAIAYAAAAIGGAGGSLLWVAVRAMVSERLDTDSAVYPRLMAAEGKGSWIAFVAGLALLGAIEYRGVFLLCAAACLVGAGVLLTGPRRPPSAAVASAGPAVSGSGLGAIGRRLRPMLLAVVITETAEAAIGVLLLLHLQRGFDLQVLQIAFVFLPGAIAMSVLPPHLHGLVLRLGRTRVLAGASVASAIFAAALAAAPNPYVIAVLWILAAAAWSAAQPIQQAVIAETSAGQAGRGMGLYESTALIGAFVGSMTAGVLYDAGSWAWSCLVFAGVILAGCVLAPAAVRRLGVHNVPQASA